MSSRNDQKSQARSSITASDTTLNASMSHRTQLAPNPTIALFIRSIIRARSFSLFLLRSRARAWSAFLAREKRAR
jgi:hypothetical protein